MTRTFEVTVKIGGAGKINWENKDGVTTFKLKGNKRSTQNSIINSIKKDLSKTSCTLEEVIKFTETTENTSKKTTIIGVLKAFTGMEIATYTVDMTKDGYSITLKNGKTMEFNTDGTQKGKQSRFNNRLVITKIAEA